MTLDYYDIRFLVYLYLCWSLDVCMSRSRLPRPCHLCCYIDKRGYRFVPFTSSYSTVVTNHLFYHGDRSSYRPMHPFARSPSYDIIRHRSWMLSSTVPFLTPLRLHLHLCFPSPHPRSTVESICLDYWVSVSPLGETNDSA